MFVDGCLMDFEWFCDREFVKTSTALARELDFQGLEGFGSVYFRFCLGGWFRDGSGNGF